MAYPPSQNLDLRPKKLEDIMNAPELPRFGDQGMLWSGDGKHKDKHKRR